MDVRAELLRFLDDRVFWPALNAAPERYDRQGRGQLARVQHSVRNTRLRYHGEYTSAEQVKTNFRSDLVSVFGQSLAAEMFLLGLTRFEDVKDEFLTLCGKHGV